MTLRKDQELLKTTKIFLPLLIHIIIAFGYFFDNFHADVTFLSSDLLNILPMCKKFDNPLLYQNDLYLNDFRNIEYYIPFFVNTWRWVAAFCDYDYVRALNIILLISNIGFGLLWYLVMWRITNKFYLSLFMSIFIRTTFALPCGEMWGISDLGTMMPRTLYLTLLPIPFLLYNTSVPRKILAALSIGFIGNFHPISGIAGLLIFYTIIPLYEIYYLKNNMLSTLKTTIMLIPITLMGLMPYIFTYLFKMPHNLIYPKEIYQQALYARISEIFFSPKLVIAAWLRKLYLALIWFPILLYSIIALKKPRIKKSIKRLSIILIPLVFLFSLAFSTFYFEAFFNNVFNTNICIAFQLIRVQKFVILSGFFSILFCCEYLIIKYPLLFTKNFMRIMVILYILVLSLSKLDNFDNVPFMGNDLFRRNFPNSLSFENSKNIGDPDLSELLVYIKNNTANNCKIYGPYVIRAGAERSVDLDFKGASILIEGSPDRLIKWYQMKAQFEEIENLKFKAEYLRQNNFDYVVSVTDWPLKNISKIGKWNFYSLSSSSR